ncbi:DUF6438 domain-containing protein [Aestuariivivens insulae]|uniref:DUF6438 domain-containing protein n=1 Tax=Aestuariivivens insulae TaxID=1621988 RepID=UPI001F5AC150|nr:DUF6438 domain-containing protein [Aestuariivivens insulae]
MTLLTSYFASKQPLNKNTHDAFLSLFKGKSSNNGPVYDLWIFDDGNIIYKGISNVEKIGVHKTEISLDVINRIKSFARNLTPNEVGKAKGRENPLTILKFNNRKVVYQSSRAKGNLLELHNLLEYIVININKEL